MGLTFTPVLNITSEGELLPDGHKDLTQEVSKIQKIKREVLDLWRKTDVKADFAA